MGDGQRWKPIVDNIEARYDAFLEQENRVNRTKMVDNRVHACLYFIQPTGHSCVLFSASLFSLSLLPLHPAVLVLENFTQDGKGKKTDLTLWLGFERSMVGYRLKPIDIEFMRRLHLRVNLIPVIAKSDTLTDEEIAAFKARVRLPSLSPSFPSVSFPDGALG